MKVRVEVPATIGNVGPGFDVLGLAVDGIFDAYEAEFCNIGEGSIKVSGRDAALIPRQAAANAFTIAAQAVAIAAGAKRQQEMRVDIIRQIPACGGLGASAAASLAGALAMAKLLAIDLSAEEILGAALVGEGAVSGRHLDNLAPCYYGGLCVVLKLEPPQILPLTVDSRWVLALVTPAQQLETKKARSVLPKSLNEAAWVQQMALCTGVVQALVSGASALLAEVLHDPFAEPRRAPLIPGFVAAKAAALQSGAVGASISGAGPTIFAVFDSLARARTGADAMASAMGPGATSHVAGVAQSGARCWQLN